MKKSKGARLEDPQGWLTRPNFKNAGHTGQISTAPQSLLQLSGYHTGMYSVNDSFYWHTIPFPYIKQQDNYIILGSIAILIDEGKQKTPVNLGYCWTKQKKNSQMKDFNIMLSISLSQK